MSLPEKWMPGGAYYQAVLEKIKTSERMFFLDSIPADALDEEMALAWVTHRIDGLYSVPVHLRTTKVCKEAVRKCATSITLVPNDVLDREMCVIASKGCFQLGHIPSHFLDEEMVLNYISSRRGMNVLGEIPVSLRNEKVCTEAYRSSSTAMKNIPRELQFVVYENGVSGDFETIWKERVSALVSALGPPPLLVRQYAGMQCADGPGEAPLARQFDESS